MKTITIHQAKRAEFQEVASLIERCGLPIDGLPVHLDTTLVATDGEAVVGCAALELYGDNALLRSVAVDAGYRSRSIGQQLFDSAVTVAKKHGVTTLFLLTETAVDYFSRRGFSIIDRSQVPTTVRQSVEFTSACPASALAMKLVIGTGDWV